MKRLTSALAVLAGAATLILGMPASALADTGDLTGPGQPPTVIVVPPVVIAWIICSEMYPPGSRALRDCIDRHS